MRLGLIGLKGHQSVVLDGAKQLGNVEVVAVSDDSQEEVDRFKKRQPLAKNAELYKDWKQLLEHSMLDVCCLCDENHLRAEQLIALARRNVHIVTEKPLTTTLDDLERVRAALARSKSKLTMLLTMRHEAKYAKMRELVRAGTIGEVCQATVQKSYQLHSRPDWFKERKRLGGTIPYIGIHAVDLIRWVTGLDYTHVAAFHGRIGKPEMKETESHASLLLRLSNGGSATARLDYLRPQPAPSHGDDRLRVIGTEGVVELRYPDNAVSVITASKKAYTVEPDPVLNLFVAFAQALDKNQPPPIPTDDCIRVTEVVLKARDAADGQKLVDLTPAKTNR